MYHPYVRGKQYELITIREMASVIATAGFTPIIEPVRETLSGLQKALEAVVEADGQAIVIVNPHHGELSADGTSLTQLLKDEFNHPKIAAGILLKEGMTTEEALKYYGTHKDHGPVFIHAGFSDAKTLAQRLSKPTARQWHVFDEGYCGKLYQKHFAGAHRVLLRDGFERKRNADYHIVEPFSDLHATYKDEGMDGFGDFLIVGDDFTEGGGPAYAVAIHLTYINPDQDDTMQVYHFVSKTQDTPLDPAGKFAEALSKMIETLDDPNSHVLETDAVEEFRDLHEQGHFPGLGYIKKLSMNHHIDTLADYLRPK
ncbi:MAG TPA: sce7725 family protein [Steroidobacteraceae bacterium]|nr:sce7725 family protein [Steroidobacteraceae bacterium]